MFSRRSHGSIVIAYHIGSSSVSAAALKLSPNERPHIVAVSEEALPYRDVIHPERHITDMLEALRKARLDLVRASRIGHEATAVFYVFSSPWTSARTRTVTIKRSEPFLLTPGYVAKVVENHDGLFGRGVSQNGMRILERRIIDARLDGALATKLYATRAKKAELTIYTSEVPASLFAKVVEIGGTPRSPQNMQASSFALSAFTVLRDIFPAREDFAFVDVGDDVTDVVSVRGGAIAEVSSIALGRHSIIRQAARELGLPVHEAESLIRTHREGRTEVVQTGRLKHLLIRSAEDWKRALSAVGGASQATFVAGQDGIVSIHGSQTLAPESFSRFVSSEKGVSTHPRVALIALAAAKLFDSSRK